MTDQWRELKETITELRDNNGIATQQEVCRFLANYMDVLEKQIIWKNQYRGMGHSIRREIKENVRGFGGSGQGLFMGKAVTERRTAGRRMVDGDGKSI